MNHLHGTTKAKLFSGFPVNNLDTGLSYATIQEAINANETLGGHRLLLDYVPFNERVVVNKSLSICGTLDLEHPETQSTINGGGAGNAMTIEVDNVTICGVSVENGTCGIFLNHTDNCQISWGYMHVSDCTGTGIYVYYSRNCTLAYVSMFGNRYNFGVEGEFLEHFIHSIIHCTADGKPIIYM
jgi:nitrous oxidase accessory protein NosD